MSSSNELKDVLSSTSKLASYNIVLQLIFRILTFILNAFTLRYISRETLGVVNVRLALLCTTILFLSKEAFRRACLSKAPTNEKNEKLSYVEQWTKIINISWCIVPVGLLCTILLTYIWIQFLETPDPSVIPHYSVSAIIIGCSAFLELIAEPLWVLAQALLFVKLKVFSEGLAMVVKCISTVILVVYLPHYGILSFAIAQILFSSVYVGIYYGYFTWYVTSKRYKKYDDFPFTNPAQFFPTFSSNAIDANTAKLTWSFFKQSFLKQLLTEGERYVMTLLNVLSFGDQGVYDIINNLGSLAARFIFLPIEESFYVFFAKVLERGVPAENQNNNTIMSVKHVLFCLLRLVVLMASVILVFGYSYAFLLLDIYGGSLLSEGSGPLLLRTYCFYVLMIAINGTTECFVFAAMSQNDVDRYNKKLLGFSLLFLVSSYYLTMHLGAIGFILANCLNMGARILHSVYFMQRYFNKKKHNPLAGIIPEPAVIGTLLFSFLICFASERLFCCRFGILYKMLHVAVGAACLACNAAIIYFKEKVIIEFLKEQYFTKPKTL